MAIYTVSFEIKYDSSYDDRYKTFNACVQACDKWWAETTSFYIVQTGEDIDAFCDRIYFGSTFDSSKDIYVVLDALVKSGRARGNITDDTLFALLPFVKKL